MSEHQTPSGDVLRMRIPQPRQDLVRSIGRSGDDLAREAELSSGEDPTWRLGVWLREIPPLHPFAEQALLISKWNPDSPVKLRDDLISLCGMPITEAGFSVLKPMALHATIKEFQRVFKFLRVHKPSCCPLDFPTPRHQPFRRTGNSFPRILSHLQTPGG